MTSNKSKRRAVLNSHIKINILKIININRLRFTEIESELSRKERATLAFHLNGLREVELVLKDDQERIYYLSDLGYKLLQISQALDGLLDSIHDSKLNLEPLSIQKEEPNNQMVDETPLFFPRKIDNLPPNLRTIDFFTGLNSMHMQESYSKITLPAPIDENVSPNIWIENYVKQLDSLLADNEAFIWLEDRLLKLAYGTRGMEEFSLMDSLLAVPPLEQTFSIIRQALMDRGKVGLFTSTGMGKSRLLLYIATWWMQQHKTNALFINNPLDMFDKDWELITEALIKISSNNDNEFPSLLIIDDLHVASEETINQIKKLIGRIGNQSWVVLLSYTKQSTQMLSGELIKLQHELQPPETSDQLDLADQWFRLRPYFFEWIKWATSNVLLNSIPLDIHSWQDSNLSRFKSPWAFVVALGFLKHALVKLRESSKDTDTKHMFPLILYSFLAQLFPINNELGIKYSQLLGLLQKSFADDLVQIYGDNWEHEIEKIIELWTDPILRLLPPFQYIKSPGKIVRERIINFYHYEWAINVCDSLLLSPETDAFEFTSKIIKDQLPTVYQIWEYLNNHLTNEKMNFLTWIRRYIRIYINERNEFLLTKFKPSKKEYQYLIEHSIPSDNFKSLNDDQRVNYYFIKGNIKDFANRN